MQSEEALSERIIFLTLGFALLLGILGSITLLIMRSDKPDPFTAISFPDSAGLPNLVSQGENYNHLYSVQSFENETRSYNLTAYLTAYRLYNLIEEEHSCLRDYHKKIYISWENVSELAHITRNDTNSFIPDMQIKPPVEAIDWPYYHFDFTMGRAMGDGEFLVWFGLNETTKYQFTFDSGKHEVRYWNYTVGKLNLSNQNDRVKIYYDSHYLNLSFNGETKYYGVLENATHGQFGFESRDLFIGMNGIMLYKEKPYEIPVRSNVWDYVFDDNFFFNIINKVEESTTHELRLTRSFISRKGGSGNDGTFLRETN